MSSLSQKQYHRLGWDDREGTDTHKRLRGLVIEIGCGNGYQKCMLLRISLKSFTFRPVGNGGLELLERSVDNSSVSETHFSSLLSDLSSNSYALPIVENFLNLYPNTGLTNKSRVNGLTEIQQNIDWIQHNADTIGQWLRYNHD
ncbi:unnamed protein product [Oppiella nova]|uniref:Uncharacterized protein n=1 Tax=Oppiella nova TaxID=334625 RepID=A0A7R9M4M1_9ACAR|nr:unnamed protein product [Oppiella nova]CAG2169366.1 unnamed protein product [Oppiella nova]